MKLALGWNNLSVWSCLISHIKVKKLLMMTALCCISNKIVQLSCWLWILLNLLLDLRNLPLQFGNFFWLEALIISQLWHFLLKFRFVVGELMMHIV